MVFKHKAQKVDSRATIGDMISFVTKKLLDEKAYFGHGTDNANDEAVALVLHALNLPFDVGEEKLLKTLPQKEIDNINRLLGRRVKEKIPLSYLTNVIYFAGLEFYVDYRVIIPRSPMAELIENRFSPWINSHKVHNILDLCCGSGCIAIACAKMFPSVSVDAIDISQDALNVAHINIEKHRVHDRVRLIKSDLFAGIKHNKRYDIIISNPPYVSEQEMKNIPDEYRHEPKNALVAEDDGLSIVMKIIKHSKEHLADDGVLFVEVGNGQEKLEKKFSKLPFTWLEFARGGSGVFMLKMREI